ncbi:hypothetical protein RHGRI_009820 [Rhododendron griersonianum]|uniref:RRM domain-containing protein n=1 Tax=Rhododendron griersonianum TaxID=479676 RepID=A0AAV6KG91_9ERIC|nr:hypothetical protein RHGRI_009820 [Rhododendron griersonianum]
MAELITVYADNLPLAMDVDWLRQLFNPYGRVEDVYSLAREVRNVRMFVQLAKYSKVSPKVNRMRQEGDKNGNLASSVHKGLPKSVVGLGSSFVDVVADEGISYIQAREMGGNLVLLIFDSLEDMSLMLEEAGKCWLRNWFVDVKKWSPDLKFVSKREVWLSCYGVPLNFWKLAEEGEFLDEELGDFDDLEDGASLSVEF